MVVEFHQEGRSCLHHPDFIRSIPLYVISRIKNELWRTILVYLVRLPARHHMTSYSTVQHHWRHCSDKGSAGTSLCPKAGRIFSGNAPYFLYAVTVIGFCDHRLTTPFIGKLAWLRAWPLCECMLWDKTVNKILAPMYAKMYCAAFCVKGVKATNPLCIYKDPERPPHSFSLNSNPIYKNSRIIHTRPKLHTH